MRSAADIQEGLRHARAKVEQWKVARARVTLEMNALGKELNAVEKGLAEARARRTRWEEEEAEEEGEKAKALLALRRPRSETSPSEDDTSSYYKNESGTVVLCPPVTDDVFSDELRRGIVKASTREQQELLEQVDHICSFLVNQMSMSDTEGATCISTYVNLHLLLYYMCKLFIL